MEHISVRRLANLLLSFALLLGVCAGCKKKTETAAPAATPTPTPAAPQSQAAPPFATPRKVAPPITGSVTPAVVNQDAESFAHYLHFPTDPEAAKLDGAVQFYSDVTDEGFVETTHALIGNSDAFKATVQKALDWGRFTPATVDGKPVRAYLGGTVLFLHQDGKELIVVSLATHDRDRVGKMENYIQPQLIGGLRHALEKTIASLKQGVVVGGRAEVVVNVDAKGAITGTSALSESPKGSGLGVLLNDAVRGAQFTPAYENGEPAAGGINVVADFAKF
jgi:hypothetical protein